MSMSKMKADKINLDLRDLILNVLESIYLLRSDKESLRREGVTCLERGKRGLDELKKRNYMLDSLAHFYDFDLDLEDLTNLIGLVSKQGHFEDAQARLAKLLQTLEEKFDDRVQEGILQEKY